ncbi:MAG: hypothetical protein WBE14_04345, partial [Xanthobacteraceae bacterium]
MTETPSTSTTRVKAHRARKSRGVYLALIEVAEARVDRLADEGYLDGENTVAHECACGTKARGTEVYVP